MLLETQLPAEAVQQPSVEHLGLRGGEPQAPVHNPGSPSPNPVLFRSASVVTAAGLPLPLGAQKMMSRDGLSRSAGNIPVFMAKIRGLVLSGCVSPQCRALLLLLFPARSARPQLLSRTRRIWGKASPEGPGAPGRPQPAVGRPGSAPPVPRSPPEGRAALGSAAAPQPGSEVRSSGAGAGGLRGLRGGARSLQGLWGTREGSRRPRLSGVRVGSGCA